LTPLYYSYNRLELSDINSWSASSIKLHLPHLA